MFPPVIAAISRYVHVEDIEAIFGSHQDPDVLSSFPLWGSLSTSSALSTGSTTSRSVPPSACSPRRNTDPRAAQTILSSGR